MICPRCGSSQLQKKGTRAGKQRYRCNSCKAYFTDGIKYKSNPKYLLKDPDLRCPCCESSHIVRDGKLEDGTQRYKCVDCSKCFSDKTFVKDLHTHKNKISTEKKKKVLEMIFKGASVPDVASKVEYTERTVRAIVQPYYEKEILSKEQKEMILKYGYYLKVPIDYLAEYVPCSRKACRELLEKFKSTNLHAKLKNPSKIYRSFFAQNQ